MSYEYDEGEELAYCGQPVGEDRFRMVKLIVNRVNPSGHVKIPVFRDDLFGRPQERIDTEIVPVELVPVGVDLYVYSDDNQRISLLKKWVEIYQADNGDASESRTTSELLDISGNESPVHEKYD